MCTRWLCRCVVCARSVHGLLVVLWHVCTQYVYLLCARARFARTTVPNTTQDWKPLMHCVHARFILCLCLSVRRVGARESVWWRSAERGRGGDVRMAHGMLMDMIVWRARLRLGEGDCDRASPIVIRLFGHVSFVATRNVGSKAL